MIDITWRSRTLVALAAVGLAVLLPGAAAAQEALGSRVNALVVFDFSTDYITPRGLHVEDQGVVAQPLMLLLWKLRAADKGAVSDVTLTTGLWNSFHSHKAGFKPSRWNEVDPILGVTVKLRKGLTVDAGTTAFYTPTESYATSTHADVKVTFNNAVVSGVSLNPYVGYWVELNNKSTVMFNRATSKEGSYLRFGAAPSFGLGAGGSSLEIAASANVVSSSFYQRFDGSDGGAGLAVVSIAPKVSVPLKGLGISHGAWTAYAGATYYHLRNEGLLDGNQVLLAGGERTKNLAQFRGGLSVFF
jgi:hypothetical protein